MATYDLKQFGDRTPSPAGRKVAAVPTAKTAIPSLQRDRYFRIGKAPDASAYSSMRGAMNQAMAYRTKSLFEWTSILGQGSGLPVTSAGAGLRARYRGAFHTGPYHHAVYATVYIYPQTAGFNSAAYVQVDIYSDATEVTNVSSTKFYYGNNPLNSANVVGWQYMKEVNQYIDGLAADTDYYVKISDGDNGLVQSVCLAEFASPTENNSGWLATNYTQESLILDSDQSTLLGPMPSLWKRGAAKIFNWTVDTQASPQTVVAASGVVNLIDATSTTYGAAIPGFTLDMTGKKRLSNSFGVPVTMWAYIDCTSAGVGILKLRDSGGTALLSCSYGGAGSAPRWYGSSFYLPDSAAKYYLTMETSAGTFKVYACSLYEYET